MKQEEFLNREYSNNDTVTVSANALKEVLISRDILKDKYETTKQKLERCYDENEFLMDKIIKLEEELKNVKKNAKLSSYTLAENEKIKKQLIISEALRSSLKDQLKIEKFKQPKCPKYVEIRI